MSASAKLRAPFFLCNKLPSPVLVKINREPSVSGPRLNAKKFPVRRSFRRKAETER